MSFGTFESIILAAGLPVNSASIGNVRFLPAGSIARPTFVVLAETTLMLSERKKRGREERETVALLPGVCWGASEVQEEI